MNWLFKKKEQQAPPSPNTSEVSGFLGPGEMVSFISTMTKLFVTSFGPRAAIIVSAGMPENGNHDAYASNWAGPCLTAKGLIHFAIPEIDDRIRFTTKVVPSGSLPDRAALGGTREAWQQPCPPSSPERGSAALGESPARSGELSEDSMDVAGRTFFWVREAIAKRLEQDGQFDASAFVRSLTVDQIAETAKAMGL